VIEQTFANLWKVTESAVRTQQEIFTKYVGSGPFAVPFPGGMGDLLKYQKKSAQIISELMKKQCEVLEVHIDGGLRSFEEACQIVETKDPEEIRKKTLALWQKTFDSLRQIYSGQVRDFQTAVANWNELVTQSAASGVAVPGSE